MGRGRRDRRFIDLTLHAQDDDETAIASRYSRLTRAFAKGEAAISESWPSGATTNTAGFNVRCWANRRVRFGALTWLLQSVRSGFRPFSETQ